MDWIEVRKCIIERANIAATKANAPEIWHALVLLVAYIDKNEGLVNPPTGDSRWFTAKKEEECKAAIR